MKIWNVRLGLAMNSSSTHSLLLLGPGETIPDQGVGDSEFGWDHWTATSQDAKKNYFGLLVYQNMCRLYPNRIAAVATRELFGLPLKEEKGGIDGYIDHQSVYTLPVTWDGGSLDEGFLKELRDYLMRDDLIIVGGNDNEDTDHPLVENHTSASLPLWQDDDNKQIVARKDAKHGYWTIFNRQSGAKLRFSFDDEQMGSGRKRRSVSDHGTIMYGKTPEQAPQKATAPELVDIKITDYCPFGCAFCYQGSTASGKHAPLAEITNIIEMLAKERVFEIAIGGGEPTLHPDFLEILRYARSQGITPNFTTKNLAWLADYKNLSQVMRHAGGFAFSASNREEVDRLAGLLKENKPDHGYGYRVTVQHVLGSEYSLEEILEAVTYHHLPLTLLGYKTDGRGKEFEPKIGASEAFQQIKKFTKDKYLRLGIDTLLAQQWETELKQAKVSETFYQTQEGKFSMYIDAVNGTAGASSYGGSPMIPYAAQYYDGKRQRDWHVDRKGKTLLEIFESF